MTVNSPLAALAVAALAAPLAAIPAERSLDKEVVVAASLDQAWAAWTTREGITSFFAPEAEIEAKVGGAFHIFFNPLAGPGEKGADDMRFMALQPQQMLSFDWNAPPSLPLGTKPDARPMPNTPGIGRPSASCTSMAMGR